VTTADEGAMPGSTSLPQPAWRKVVRATARAAAAREIEESGDGASAPVFNYRWEHVKAVVRTAVRLAEVTGADREIVEAAAWLHDVRKGDSRDHGRDGAITAREILAQTDFPPLKIEAVAQAIARHVGLSTTGRIEPLEAAVLWDADKLAKLGAVAVIHFAGFLLGRRAPSTAALLKQLSDASWQEDVVRSFNTAPAQAAGRQRLEAYRTFCQQARAELDGADLQ
jgi:uncharacterized protein